MNEAELLHKIRSIGFRNHMNGYSTTDDGSDDKLLFRCWRLPEENRDLIGTPFCYTGENDFLHFTSIDNISGILNSKHLRLYNLHNMDDKFELNYASKNLSLKNSSLDDKRDIFILSSCSASEILKEPSKQRKHMLWKIHGRNGYGVIIRFKFINSLNRWYRFYLTRCFYDLGNFEQIKKLNELTRLETFDSLMASFVKLPIYEFENEVRLIFDYRSGNSISKGGEIVFPVISQDKYFKEEYIAYFQLPIYNFFQENEEMYPKLQNSMKQKFELPKICITELILGYRYSDSDLQNIRRNISLPGANIRHSELAEYY